MKKFNIKGMTGVMAIAIAALAFTSCENGENEFPGYDKCNVYFANQYVMRTVELGEDLEVDLTNDNNHIVEVRAAMGGGYGNDHDITLEYTIDNSLIEGKQFADGSAMEVLPANYYTIENNKMVIPAGSIQGGIKIKLTDAFFADENATKKHYVLPIKLTNVSGADSILESKNFILYGLKFVNPWHATYLRRGVDNFSDGSKVVRHTQYVEKYPLQTITTSGFMNAQMTINMKNSEGKDIPCTLDLKFDGENKCSISTATQGFSATGNGTFVIKGEKNSMGGKDRNALYLNYSIKSDELNTTMTTTDTLVVRNRGIAPEYFTVK